MGRKTGQKLRETDRDRETETETKRQREVEGEKRESQRWMERERSEYGQMDGERAKEREGARFTQRRVTVMEKKAEKWWADVVEGGRVFHCPLTFG